MTQIWQPEAEGVLSSVMELLPFGSAMYNDEDSHIRKNIMATYGIALNLKSGKLYARENLFGSDGGGGTSTTTPSTTHASGGGLDMEESQEAETEREESYEMDVN